MALWPITPMSAMGSDRTIIIMKDDSEYVPGFGEPSTDDMKYPVLLMDVAQKIVKEEEKEGKGSLLTEKQKKKLSRYIQKLGFENIAATFYDSNAGSRKQVVNFDWVVSLNLYVITFIIHSKYFAVSNWLQYPFKFFITNWRLPYLEDASNIPLIRWYELCY